MENQLFPDTSPSPWPITRTGAFSGLLIGLSLGMSKALLSHFSQNVVSTVAAVCMILGVMPLFGFGIYYLGRWILGLDELQRVIQFKAFTWVVPITWAILIVNDLLRASGLSVGFQWNGVMAGWLMFCIYSVIFPLVWWRSR